MCWHLFGKEVGGHWHQTVNEYLPPKSTCLGSSESSRAFPGWTWTFCIVRIILHNTHFLKSTAEKILFWLYFVANNHQDGAVQEILWLRDRWWIQGLLSIFVLYFVIALQFNDMKSNHYNQRADFPGFPNLLENLFTLGKVAGKFKFLELLVRRLNVSSTASLFTWEMCSIKNPHPLK